MSNPTDDVKIQNLLAKLEDLFEDDDDEHYILCYKPDTTGPTYNGESSPIYAGEIEVHMLPTISDEDDYIMTVGQVPDGRHARKLIEAANAMPQLLAYITQLEAKVR